MLLSLSPRLSQLSRSLYRTGEAGGKKKTSIIVQDLNNTYSSDELTNSSAHKEKWPPAGAANSEGKAVERLQKQE